MAWQARPFTRRIGGAVAAAAALAGLGLVASGTVQASDPPFPVQLVRVDVPDWDARDRLTNLPLDLTEHGGPDFVEVVLHSPADASLLAGNGFTWTVEIPDLGLREWQNQQANIAYAAAVDESPLPSGRDTYRTLADYEADLQALAEANPGLVELIELNHPSVEGRTIYGVEIAEGVAATSDGRPTFLMMGLHHAREWPSGEHAMEFAIDLVENHGSDPRITGLLQRTRVVVVPVVNPDGFEQSRKWGDIVDLRDVDDGGTITILGTPGNAYKRKNCRLPGDLPAVPGACESASPGAFGIGVDLNRNYGGGWGGAGTSNDFVGPTYRGSGPFSEPETQAVRELISERHVTTLITNHTFSNLVLRPPGVRAVGTTVDEAAMHDLGARMAAQNGYVNQHGWQLYDTTGTTEDWSYAATGGYGYTFEIGPDEFHPPFEKVVDEYLGAGDHAGKGNREAYLLALENAADPRHHSVITGKAPEGAVLRLSKTFQTKQTTGPSITDTLESTLVVGTGGQFSWHVNPSTRPEVLEHRVQVTDEEPAREETHTESGIVWAPGDHVDVPFSLPESGLDAMVVNLDWPVPDDLDLEVYRTAADGSLKQVGSSGNFPGEKEEAFIASPEPGEYVMRVINFASVTTEFTLTTGLYQATEEIYGGGVVESYLLTCETVDGQVLSRQWVAVDRGQVQKVDLKACGQAPKGPKGKVPVLGGAKP
jgi:hypothetical protein